MESAMKVEMVRKVNEEVAREETKVIKKTHTKRTPKKADRFLEGQDEKIAPAMIDMLLAEVWGAIANFYKF